VVTGRYWTKPAEEETLFFQRLVAASPMLGTIFQFLTASLRRLRCEKLLCEAFRSESESGH